MSAAPLPPVELGARVGGLHADNLFAFEAVGAEMRQHLLSLLPTDWTWEGSRVLDFGCGVGRTLRHFLAEAEVAELHGCDIDGPSIAWLQEHLSPPLHVLRNEESPPLPYEAETFDLIWAISVFTHLTELWSAWLLELHRILAPGGLLIATYMGEGTAAEHLGEPWDEDRTGMNVLRYGQPWELGGPFVFHSEWWIREHWGRLFEVDAVRRSGFGRSPDAAGQGQGVVLLRKRDVRATVEELERIDPSERREIAALRHNVSQLHRESLRAREGIAWLQAGGLAQQYESTLSWRVTAPLRALRRLTRRLG